jgi:hypothetical protein
MLSLISDRFLKRFFRSHMYRYRVNPANEVGNPMENEGDEPIEQGRLPGDDPLEKKAILEDESAVFPENCSPKPRLANNNRGK